MAVRTTMRTNEVLPTLINRLPTCAIPTAAMITASQSADPIRLPKIYDGRNKSFFFFSWEQFITRPFVSTVSATVPTQAYRNGVIFSALIPASGVNGVPRPLPGRFAPKPRSATTSIRAEEVATILSGTIFDPTSTRNITCSASVTPDCPAGSVVQVRTPFPNNAIPQSVLYLDPVAPGNPRS